MLARLFARPANVLVMDEPTNDLDIETLELLEELIADFPGTVLLVSHDRAFLDNIVTSTLAFEGEGRVVESVGGWADYLRHRQQRLRPERGAKSPSDERHSSRHRRALIRARQARSRRSAARAPAESRAPPLPANSPSTSSGSSTLFPRASRRSRKSSVASGRKSESGEFYKAGADHIRAVLARLEQNAAEHEAALARWLELEERSGR